MGDYSITPVDWDAIEGAVVANAAKRVRARCPFLRDAVTLRVGGRWVVSGDILAADGTAHAVQVRSDDIYGAQRALVRLHNQIVPHRGLLAKLFGR